jgi:Domain of unknown function (DUF4279)
MIKSRFTPVNDEEPACERTCAKLLIYSSTLKPEEITKSLAGTEPTSRVFAREPEGSYPGRTHGWFLSSENVVNSRDLRTHLEWLLHVILPLKSSLSELQALYGIKMYVYCPWWAKFGSGGPTIWPEQMTSLSELNLECTIDFADHSHQDVATSEE